jgi:hypothetical protein
MRRWWQLRRRCAYCGNRLNAGGDGHGANCSFVAKLRRAYLNPDITDESQGGDFTYG